MKQKWERPVTLVQEFAANEYVAACSAATLTCDRTREYVIWPAKDHGSSCNASYNSSSSKWIEDETGATASKVVIQNYDPTSRQTSYNATWETTSWLGIKYHHVGTATINFS